MLELTVCEFYFRVSVHRSVSQIKHQLDATLCRFYFCRVTLHVSSLIWWCDDLPATITPVPGRCTGRGAIFLILLMIGAWCPKHVEWLCRNKTCTVLHQVGVLTCLWIVTNSLDSEVSYGLALETALMHVCWYGIPRRKWCTWYIHLLRLTMR